MAKPTVRNKKKPVKGQHRWKFCPPDCVEAIELEKRLKTFEDATTKLRCKLAKDWGVIYHPMYFTRVVPDLRKKT